MTIDELPRLSSCEGEWPDYNRKWPKGQFTAQTKWLNGQITIQNGELATQNDQKDQESQFKQRHYTSITKSAILPLATMGNFACSVSSLSHFLPHYRPGYQRFQP